jgi:protein-S-isoprenylcysteine O-methyltransferase Ste14
MSTAYLVFTFSYVGGLLIRDIYEFLKKTNRVDPKNTWLFVGVFATMIVMWFSWFVMGFLDPARLIVPAALKFTGLGVVILGLVLALWGMWQLKGVENIDHLVTGGIYTKIRHPMYAGFILWILGYSVFQGAYISLTIGLFGLASILWWRRLEEQDLLSVYGAEYAEYRAGTWF